MEAAKHIATEQETAPGLSQRDREILEFERHWWKYAGAKEQAVREKFDMSSTRYYQVLNALIDRPEALEEDPLLVRRLRRLRSSRQRQRSARRPRNPGPSWGFGFLRVADRVLPEWFYRPLRAAGMAGSITESLRNIELVKSLGLT